MYWLSKQKCWIVCVCLCVCVCVCICVYLTIVGMKEKNIRKWLQFAKFLCLYFWKHLSKSKLWWLIIWLKNCDASSCIYLSKVRRFPCRKILKKYSRVQLNYIKKMVFNLLSLYFSKFRKILHWTSKVKIMILDPATLNWCLMNDATLWLI